MRGPHNQPCSAASVTMVDVAGAGCLLGVGEALSW